MCNKLLERQHNQSFYCNKEGYSDDKEFYYINTVVS